MTLLLPGLGVALLLLLVCDVFVTVFHPEGHGGPFTRRLSSFLWESWRSMAPKGSRRDEWLALGGPLLAVLTPATWALLLVVGFALIYFPWIGDFLASPGSLRAYWAEALYYSGFTAATLGTGDIIADLPALRLLTVAEALSGFVLVTASLTYILAIYRENGRKTTLAYELAVRYQVQPDAMRRGLRDQGDGWLAHVAAELLHISQAHAQYPILHFFRPSNHDGVLAAQLGPIVAMAASLEPADPAGDPPVRGEDLLAEALRRYLEAADERFIRKGSGRRNGNTAEDRYLRLLEYLGYEPSDVGYPSSRDG